MYYDDRARRFNYLSGALAGLLLGVGVGLLVAPRRPSRRPRRIRDSAERLRRETRAGAERLRTDILEPTAEALGFAGTEISRG